MVGRSGIVFERCAVVTASARSRPSWTNGFRTVKPSIVQVTWPATRSTTACPPPLYGTWVARRPDARRHETQLTRLGLGQADQFGNRTRRHVLVHGQHLRSHAQARDRRQV